eukprot:UC1_evm4s2186
MAATLLAITVVVVSSGEALLAGAELTMAPPTPPHQRRQMQQPIVTTTSTAVSAAASKSAPYFILDPTRHARILGEDYDWAVENIPLFEAANGTLEDVYYFRWRSFRSHIHNTGDAKTPYVVTEFAPNVGWAGMFNTINCAAGHHITEGGWLRNTSIVDSYTRWWVDSRSRHNYYYWLATALRRNYDKYGAAYIPLLRDVVPRYADQFMQYAAGQLPGGANSAFDSAHDCLWNAPGNEGQEQTISGPGCRTLVQALMHGEARSLSRLFAAIGDGANATRFDTEADRWRARTLRLWNTNISGFDTRRSGGPPKPPPPPPPKPLPGFTELPSHAGTFCCDQSKCVDGHSTFLYQGPRSFTDCETLCVSNAKCKYMTHAAQPGRGAGWCFNAEYCNTTNPFQGAPPQAVQTYAYKHLAVGKERRRTRGGGGGGRGSITAHGSDSDSAFAKVDVDPLPFANVRELASLTSPWFFQAVPDENASMYGSAWETAFDPDGLMAPAGLRTAERRHPGYFCDLKRPGSGNGCCKWSGPMWPFETSKALTAATLVLNNAAQSQGVPSLTHQRWWDMMWQYTRSHTPDWRVIDVQTGQFYSNLSSAPPSRWLFNGTGQLWIAESGCADRRKSSEDGGGGGVPGNADGPAWTDNAMQGYRYNHATFCDLVLAGVVGLQPQGGSGKLVVNPLVRAETLPWFAADGVALHGHIISVVFDAQGSTRYGFGPGLFVLVDGKVAASSKTLQPLTVQLSQ